MRSTFIGEFQQAAKKRTCMPTNPAKCELKLKRGRPSVEQEAMVSSTIIQAATTQFLTHGYEACTIEAVAQLAGVYKNAIYKRYTNKEALFRAVMESKVAEWSALACALEDDPGETLEERLQSHLRRAIRWSSHHEVRAFRRLRQSLSPEARSIISAAGLTGQQAMINLIAEDIRQFTIQEGVPAKHPQRIAEALLSMVAGWLDNERQGKSVSKKSAASYAEWLVNLVLKGRQAW